MSANCGVTGPLIDKDEVLGDNCLRAVAELLARTSRLEKRLWDPNKETRIHRGRLPRRVNYAAQCLRDWGLNAEADKMIGLWGDFFRAWTDGIGTPCDESLVNRLGQLNQWLGDTLRQWMIAAGHTLDDLEGNAVDDGKQRELGEPKDARTKPRRVSDKTEKVIEKAIRALPSFATQQAVAHEAGVNPKTVRYSKAWADRWKTWGMANPSSGTAEVDQDTLLDLESFVGARLDVAHHKTKRRVTRFMADGDKRDHFFACLAEAKEQLGSQGKELHKLPDEEAAAVIRWAGEVVAEAARPKCKPDKCPA